MPRVSIPNVGEVDFPDTMTGEEVNTAAARLYAETQGPGPQMAATAAKQLGPTAAELATSTLPAAGGIAGSMLGPPVVGAAIGGIVGENLRQAGNKILGIKSTTGPGEELKAGAVQGTLDLLGIGAAKVATKVVAPFAEKAATLAVKTVRALADKYGVKLTPGQALDSPLLRGLEFAGTITGPGRAAANVRRVESFTAIRNAVENTLTELSPEASPMATGAAVKNAVDVARKNFQAEASRLYESVDEATGNTPIVDTSGLRALAEKELARFPKLKTKFASVSGPSGELANILDDLAPQLRYGKGIKPSDLPTSVQAAIKAQQEPAPMLSFAEANQLRSDILERARESGKADVVAFAKRATESLHTEMQKAATKLGPDVLSKWDAAREFYRGGKTLMESATYGALLKSDPEVLVNSIQPNRTTDLQEVKQAILGLAHDDKAFDGFRRQWIAGQLKGIDGQLEDLTQMPQKIASWKPEFVKEMFGDVRGQQALRNMKEISQVIDAMGKKSALAGLQHLSEAYHVMGVAAAIMSGDVVKGGKILAGTYYAPYLLTKTMQSKVATEYLVNGLAQIPKNTGKALANITRAFDIAQKGVRAVEAARSEE